MGCSGRKPVARVWWGGGARDLNSTDFTRVRREIRDTPDAKSMSYPELDVTNDGISVLQNLRHFCKCKV